MRFLIPFLLPLVLGCNTESVDDTAADDGGQFGEESGRGCVVLTETELTLDQISSLGFSANQALAIATVDETDELLYVDGSKTGYHLTVGQSGGARLVEMEWDSGTSGTEMAVDCPPYVAIDAIVTLDTEDGLFAEAWDSELRAASLDDIRWLAQLDAVAGTFDIADFVEDPGQFDSMSAWVSATFDALGSHGVIAGQGEGTNGATAFASSVDVGSWPLADQY